MPRGHRRAEAPDTGLLAALKECIAEQGLEVEAKSHPHSIYAGTIGAAIWGAFRYEKLAELGQVADLPSSKRSSGFAQAGGFLGFPFWTIRAVSKYPHLVLNQHPEYHIYVP